MTGSPPQLKRLVHLVDAMRDHAMAVAFLRSEGVRLGGAATAALIADADEAADGGDPRCRAFLLLLSLALAEPAADALRRDVASHLQAEGRAPLAQRLVGADGARSAPESAERVPDFGRTRPLTLGERKSVARGRDRQVLARVLRDPHPDVIRILLGNPHLVEMDVVRLCATRPIVPGVLREVFRTPRWITRSEVRHAMVKNPFAPLDLALSLVPHLGGTALREVAASPELHADLRSACALALAARAVDASGVEASAVDASAAWP